MSKFDKVAKVIVGIELAGVAAFGIWGYSEARYFQGRIDMANEITKQLRRDPEKVLNDIRRQGKREAQSSFFFCFAKNAGCIMR